MSDTSHAVASLVEAINVAEGEVVAAYTFDAGPNACIFTREGPFSLGLLCPKCTECRPHLLHILLGTEAGRHFPLLHGRADIA